MELKKGQNMIEHEEDIYSRPARTWFQSGQEKLKAECTSLLVQPLVILHCARRFSYQQKIIRSWFRSRSSGQQANISG
jgi:hypothetical protein